MVPEMGESDVERVGEVVEEEDRNHLKTGEGLEEMSVKEEIIGEMIERVGLPCLPGIVVQINDNLEVLVGVIAQVLQVTEIAKTVRAPKGKERPIPVVTPSETGVVENAIMIRENAIMIGESEEMLTARGMIWRNPFVVYAIT